MKIEINTADAIALKNDIFKAVKDGKLKTWKDKSIPNDFLLTHTADQYEDVVLLRFKIEDGYLPNTKKLVVSTTFWNGREVPDKGKNAVVLGNFSAALLTHFTGVKSFQICQN